MKGDKISVKSVNKNKYYYEGKQWSKEEFMNYIEKVKSVSRIKITKDFVKGNNNKILDVGCGVGYLSDVLFGKYSLYIGTDLLKQNVSIANDIYANKSTVFTTEDIFSNTGKNVRENYFDYVIMLELIEHVDNPGEYVRQSMRLLKTNGFLIMSTPNATSITNILWNIKHGKRIVDKYALDGTESDHVVAWDKQTLQNLLVKNGLKIIDVKLSQTTITKGQSIIIKAQKINQK